MNSEKCKKCQKNATSMCNSCKSAYYCSRECQKSDWKIHKNECGRFYEVKNDEIKGRFLKAKSDICAGSVIISEESPIVIAPKWTQDDDDDGDLLKFTCVGCFENIKMLQHKCPVCFWPACGSDCIGLMSNELHGIECQFLKLGKGPSNKTDVKSIKDYFRMDALFALKILLLQRKNPKKFKTIMEMESNEKKRWSTSNYKEADEKIIYLEENFLQPLKKAEEINSQIILPLKDKKTLHKIFGIIETNAMYINLQTGTEICGLYQNTSLLQHSCLPNVSYRFDMKNGFKISVKAARDIKLGEDLATSYTHVLWPTFQRQQHLKDTKYFTCSCERCSDPTELGTNFSAMRCIGSDDSDGCSGLQLPTIDENNEFACNKCPMKVSFENVNFLTGKMNEEVDNVLASDPNINDLEQVVEKLSPFLHQNHYLLFNLKHTLIQLYGNHADSPYAKIGNEILKKKLNMCNDLLKIVNALDPQGIRIAFYISILLFEKSQCLIEMNKRKLDLSDLSEVKICLESAKKIISFEEDSYEGKQLLQKIENSLLKL